MLSTLQHRLQGWYHMTVKYIQVWGGIRFECLAFLIKSPGGLVAPDMINYALALHVFWLRGFMMH